MTGELGDIHAGRSRILKRSGCKTMDGRFHNREHEHEQIIESWILTIIEDGGVMGELGGTRGQTGRFHSFQFVEIERSKFELSLIAIIHRLFRAASLFGS